MRTSITLPDETGAKGIANAQRRGFKTSFSAYVAWLIERDSAGDVQREDLLVDGPTNIASLPPQTNPLPVKYDVPRVAEEQPTKKARKAKR